MAGGPRVGLSPGEAPPSLGRSNPLHDFLLRDRRIAWAEIAPGIPVPLRFTGAIAEHSATRRAVGLFDFSFMASFDVGGRDATAFVERLQTRAARRLRPGTIAYSLLCREDGTVLNDATVWRRGPADYTIFTGRRSDAAHLHDCAAAFDVSLLDTSARRAVCAVQGPLALRVLEAAFPGERWEAMPYFHFHTVDFQGAPCDVARLGYTGEAGFEAVVDAEAMPRLWQRLASLGAPLGLAECGFEAANVLRVEAGFMLFSAELVCPVTPFELGLGRLLDFGGGTFLGAVALRASRSRLPARRLVGMSIGRRAASGEASAAPSVRKGRGFITSEVASPLYPRAIGLGFVDSQDRWPGSSVRLQTGDVARVTRLPFYDPLKRRPRSDWGGEAA